MKKAFTLVEVVISITIFMIIILFLYQSLDSIQIVDKGFENKLEIKEKQNNISRIFFEDIAEVDETISVQKDKDNNAVVSFKSTNTYNNPFFNNITYLVSKKNRLLRVESLNKLEKKDFDKLIKDAYVDVLMDDIEKFMVLAKNDKYSFIIETKNKQRVVISTFKMEK